MFESRATAVFFATLVGLTFVLGLWGWSENLGQAEGYPISEILYRTILAFTGDSVYLQNVSADTDSLGWQLNLARHTGLAATISALFGLIFHVLRNVTQRIRAVFTYRRSIVVGASAFAIDFVARQGKFTLFDRQDTLESLQFLRKKHRGLWLPGAHDPETATGWSIGLWPKRIVFGSEDASTNVRRAQDWLRNRSRWNTRKTEVFIRIEDSSIARDLDLLSNQLRQVRVISRAETVARALVTSIAPNQLAHLRGQSQPHIVLVGLSRINMAIAEELVLRCHHPDQDPVRISVIDKDIECSKARLRAERPDLLNPEFEEFGPYIDFYEADALECRAESVSAPLLELERKFPITAVVVAAGEADKNIAISMRLRQLQAEKLVLKAPILTYNTSNNSVAPKPLTNLTSGIVHFGGRALDHEDVALEELHGSQALSIHESWRNGPTVKKTPQNEWSALSAKEQRASLRAALASVEMFYAAGLVPPFGRSLAGLRAHQTAAASALNDTALIGSLADQEHIRWNAERRAEGYCSANGGIRDNEKKLHPLIVLPAELSPPERQKDVANVETLLKGARSRFESSPNLECWRKIVRIGIIGPLKTKNENLVLLESKFLEFLSETLKGELDSYTLEAITPNATGFDRVATTLLLQIWQKETGRAGQVITIDAARPTMVDDIAADHLLRNEEGEVGEKARKDLILHMQAELCDLRTACDNQIRKIDFRPIGVSDAELGASSKRYFSSVESVQNHILDIADLMVFDTNAGKSYWSSRAAKHWGTKPSIRLS